LPASAWIAAQRPGPEAVRVILRPLLPALSWIDSMAQPAQKEKTFVDYRQSRIAPIPPFGWRMPFSLKRRKKPEARL
jgi:hypothetical protein